MPLPFPASWLKAGSHYGSTRGPKWHDERQTTHASVPGIGLGIAATVLVIATIAALLSALTARQRRVRSPLDDLPKADQTE
jgi:hypothetical protein